ERGNVDRDARGQMQDCRRDRGGGVYRCRQLVPDADRRRARTREGRCAHDASRGDPGVVTSFPDAARIALGDAQLRRNLGKATTTIRDKRARVVAEVPDWEELRDAGRAIKANVMHRLDQYLLEFEASVLA